MAVSIHRAQESDREEWNRFVSSNDGTIFHTWDWLKLFAETPLSNESLLIRDEKNRCIGIFPILAASKLGLRFGYSLPLGVGGALFEKGRASEAGAQIHEALREKFDCVQTNTLTPSSNFEGAKSPRTLPSVAVDLRPAPDAILGSFHKIARYQVRLAEKKDVEVREARDARDWEEVWRLYLTSMKRLESAGSIWKSMIDSLPSGLSKENYSALLAYHRGEAVSTHLCLQLGKSAFYFLGGSDEKHWNLHANRLLLWRNILVTRERGAATLYLGGGASSRKEDSLYQYKLRFGKPCSWYQSATSFNLKGSLALTANSLITDQARRTIRALLFR